MPFGRIARLVKASRSRDYRLAVLLAAAALAVRAVLEAVAPGVASFLVLLPAVVLAGIFCGTGPAIVAAVTGTLGIVALFFHGPLLSWPLTVAQWNALLFLPACASVLWATHALRRSAAAAAGAQARLGEVFRQIPGAAAVLEAPGGRLLLRSAQSNAVLGQGERQVARSSDLGAYGGLHPDGRPFTAGDYPIVRALQTGEVVSGERFLYRRPDGRMVDLEVHAGPVRDAAGAIVASVGMAFDVSERVEAERRLRASEASYRSQAERLRAAVEARDLLMQEADHRIKNSLQLVVSLLQLQMAKVAHPDARAALAAAIARVHAVAHAHRALQHSPDLRRIAVDTMLSELSGRIAALNPAVALRCDVSARCELDAEQAIPLGLIASEVLTTALRHAYPPGATGEITLRASCDGGMLDLLIVDDGVGLPEGGPRPGLGSTVVAALARQIGADVTRQSAPGQGVTVTIRVRAPQTEAMEPAGALAGE